METNQQFLDAALIVKNIVSEIAHDTINSIANILNANELITTMTTSEQTVNNQTQTFLKIIENSAVNMHKDLEIFRYLYVLTDVNANINCAKFIDDLKFLVSKRKITLDMHCLEDDKIADFTIPSQQVQIIFHFIYNILNVILDKKILIDISNDIVKIKFNANNLGKKYLEKFLNSGWDCNFENPKINFFLQLINLYKIKTRLSFEGILDDTYSACLIFNFTF